MGSSSTTDGTSSSSTGDTDPTTGGEPSACPTAEDDLSVMWLVSDPTRHDGVAVAFGADGVAWTATDFSELILRFHDTDGNELWSALAPTLSDIGGVTLNDVAIADDGTVGLSSTVPVPGAYDILVRWYDGAGVFLQETTWADPGFDFGYGGLTMLGGPDVVVVGHSQDQLFAARYDFAAPGVPAWTAFFGDGGANWASDIEVGDSGELFIFGHSNTVPAPVMLSYTADGNLVWNYAYPPVGGPGALQIPYGSTLDPEGRPVVVSSVDVEGMPYAGQVDRFEIDGGPPTTLLEVDFIPQDVGYDAEGRLVVSGSRPGQYRIYVRRYDPDGTMVSEYERDGRWASDLEVDDDCHVYLVGDDDTGAWMEKLY